MRKTLLVLVTGSVLVLGAALPAGAQTGTSATLSGAANGQAVQGSLGLTASGSSSTGIKKLTLTINNNTVKSQDYGGVAQSQSFSFTWNTSAYANGDYTVKVIAESNGGNATDSKRLLVDNAPSTPTGVTASVADGVVNVTWNANPEPDILGYRVTRDGTSLGQVGGTSLTDQPSPGDHSYSVTAVRRSPTQGERAGGSSSTSINVPVPPPPPSDGSTGEPTEGYGDGSDSGSDGFGSSGGDGGSVPGYGGSKGGKKNGTGSGGYGGGGSGGLPGTYGYSGGARFLSGIGLPGNLTLPGSRYGTAGGNGAVFDETFEENLPYDLDPGSATELGNENFPRNIAARSSSGFIPPDGLRWVAAGLWFIVAAALLKLLETIVAKREAEEAALAAAGDTPGPAAEAAITPEPKATDETEAA